MHGKFNGTGRGATRVIAAVIPLAAIVAYHRGFEAPFLFDDVSAIVENPTIRTLPGSWFPPAGGLSVTGRPAINFSFAINYALGGQSVWGYHVLNLAFHALAGLTLFGIVRRTLARVAGPAGVHHLPIPVGPAKRSASFPLGGNSTFEPTLMAVGVALLWVLHPLQTESVTYIVQRAEALMGLFYLLTLYCFVRATELPRPRGWLAGAGLACAVAMACKEVAASAPLVVLLYDRTCVAGSFREAWTQRRGFYASLAATWLVLAWQIVGAGGRGGTAGFGLNIGPWTYALTQGEAIVRYLGLSLWPHPLVFDYGTYLASGAWSAAPFVAVVLGLLAGTVIALRRWPAAGFLGASFFLVLAPSSSIVPIATQTIAEHRMYLPLAALVVALALLLRTALGRPGFVVMGALALAAGWLTAARNTDYRDALALWGDTVAKRPENFRARYNLAEELIDRGQVKDATWQVEEAVRRAPGNPIARHNLAVVLMRAGETQEAIAQAGEALRLLPGFVDAHVTLGSALVKAGRLPEAISEFQRALQLRPSSSEAQNNLAGAFMKAGQTNDALAAYAEAIRLGPDEAATHANLGDALLQLGRLDEAQAELNKALRLKPGFAEAHYSLGNLLLRGGRATDAVREYGEAIRLKPGFAEAHLVLGGALLQMGRVEEGLARYAEALRLSPASFAAHYNFANALFQLRRLPEAITHYEEALRLNPSLANAHANLGHALLALDRLPDAIRAFQAAAQLDPANVDLRFNLGSAWLQANRSSEAASEFEAVLRLKPGDADAQENLARARAGLAAQKRN